MTMATSARVLVISGSVAPKSYTVALAHAVGDVLGQHGASVEHWDPRDRPVPLADPAFHRRPDRHPDARVRELVAAADAADAFVWASPLHHNSYSAVIKNVLDHLAIEQFVYKPVGLVGHGGNRSPQAVDHLRIVARGLLAAATPTQVATRREDYVDAGEHLRLEDPDILQRVQRFATELVAFAEVHRVLRASFQVGRASPSPAAAASGTSEGEVATDARDDPDAERGRALGLDAVVLISDDVDAQRRFYHEMLGLRLVGDHGDAVFFECGSQKVAVFSRSHHPEGTARLAGARKGISHLEFRLARNDYPAVRQRLEQHGFHAYRDNFEDADGNLFHFNLVDDSRDAGTTGASS